jgi:hypothetical protein
VRHTKQPLFSGTALTDFTLRDVKYLNNGEALRNAMCDVGTEFAYIIYMDLRLQMG